jgi:hypothetical protein
MGYEMLICSNNGPSSLQRGDNHKNAKNGVGQFKYLLLKNSLSQKSSDLQESYLT